ncbi:MAG: Grx4 family monothiol glutaredoxin [Bacteriovoracaceae bacterium]|nr:Grx4 family monothiol glutaredoxin [Bacteriovoracaceae bacterium]
MLNEGVDVSTRIKEIINGNDIVLFMKGNAEFPQCGFSANSVAILKHLGKDFKTYDILKDPELRQALKEYSNWPTYPQLYFKTKLVGGNDIITEMYQSGDLQELFG